MRYEQVALLVRVLLGGLLAVELAGLAGAFPAIDGQIWPGLLLISGASWLAVELVNRWLRRRGLPRPPALVLITVLAAIYADAIGNMADWYASAQHFDLLVHGASGLAVTAALFYIVRDAAWEHAVNIGPRVWAYIAWSTMVVLATLFELGEWAADLVFNKSFWLGSGQDTVSDLLAAMIGGAAALLAIWAARYFQKK